MPSVQVVIDSAPAKKGAREAEQAFDKVGRSAKDNRSDVKGLEKTIDDLGTTSANVGPKVVAVFGAIGIGLGVREAITTLGSYDTAIRQVGAVSRASASELNALDAASKKIGATTSLTASAGAEGLLFLARAGFSVTESIEALPATVDLAIGQVLELGTAADITSNAIGQFGLQARDAGRVTDVLTSASNSANTNVQALGEALSQAGPIANAFGVSLEETAAAVGALGDSGIAASRAGTGLSNLLRGLGKDSGQTLTVLEELGLSLEDVDVRSVGLAGALRNLRDAGLDAAQAQALFGGEGQASALVLASAADRVEQLTSSLRASSGEAANVRDQIGAGLQGSINGLGSALEAAQLKLGQSGFAGALKGASDVAADVVRDLAGLERATKSSSIAITATGTAVVGLSGALGTVGLLASTRAAVQGISKVVTSLSPIGRAAAIVVGVGAAFIQLGRRATQAASGIANASKELRDFERDSVSIGRQSVRFELGIETRNFELARDALDAIQQKVQDIQVESRAGGGFVDISTFQGVVPALDGEIQKIAARTTASISGAVSEALTGGQVQAAASLLQDRVSTALSDPIAGVQINDAVDAQLDRVRVLSNELRDLGRNSESRRPALEDRLQSEIESALSLLDGGLSVARLDAGLFSDALGAAGERLAEDLKSQLETAQGVGSEGGERIGAAVSGGLARGFSGQDFARDLAGQVTRGAELALQGLDRIAQRQESISDIEDLVGGLEFEASISNQTAESRDRLRVARELAADAIGIEAGELEAYTARATAAIDSINANAAALERRNEVLRQAAELNQISANSLADVSFGRRQALTDLQFELDALGKSQAQLNALAFARQSEAQASAIQAQAARESESAFNLLGVAVATGSDEFFKAAEASFASADALKNEADAVRGSIGAYAALSSQLEQAQALQNIRNSFISQTANGLTQVTLSAEKASDALENLLRTLSAQLLNQAFSGGLNALLPGVVPSANGNLFSGGIGSGGAKVVPFAGGGLLSGPVAFPLAGGNIGLAAEKGPNFEELLLPVTRKNGRVMVESAGGGGSAGVTINAPISVSKNASRAERRRTTRQIQRSIRAATRV